VLPGAEARVTWNVIPIECGYVKVPRVRVLDHRTGVRGEEDAVGESAREGEALKVVDVRFERWGRRRRVVRWTWVRSWCYHSLRGVRVSRVG